MAYYLGESVTARSPPILPGVQYAYIHVARFMYTRPEARKPYTCRCMRLIPFQYDFTRLLSRGNRPKIGFLYPNQKIFQNPKHYGC